MSVGDALPDSTRSNGGSFINSCSRKRPAPRTAGYRGAFPYNGVVTAVHTHCPSVRELCLRWWPARNVGGLDEIFFSYSTPKDQRRPDWRIFIFSTASKWAPPSRSQRTYRSLTLLNKTYWRSAAAAAADTHDWPDETKDDLSFVSGSLHLEREGGDGVFEGQVSKYLDVSQASS